ncbi:MULTISPECIES: magnesium transporter [unclassified Butyrivibrio]|uniref:magnesium transporter n=1 Tax=unclassified Butyrivibrio TaxID=2639466 RepID=UPI0008F1A25E|nr:MULTISPECIES: magnesium transporter [unclassified Butyrivibrio]RKM57717.1 magnesium transporter [Butyrivibrio sp. XB500-5]SFU76074.1 magnesium transporter [Butyrivibrio sp. INlla21]
MELQEEKTIVEILKELLESRQYTKLRQTISEMNTVDIAAAMGEMEDEDSLKMFRILPKDMAADVFADLELDDQQYIIRSLSDREASTIVDNLMADDATDLLEEMPANVVKRILANASPETRADINHLLQYPEDSAGSIMTVEYVDLREDMSVTDAINRIRQKGVDSETINICYVVTKQKILVGTVALRYLLIMKPDDVIGDIMNTNVISINTMTDQEEAARMFQKYGFTAMPVVDNESRMVGIITIDDVVDILEEEATEDIEKMAAIVPSDKPYPKVGIFETYKSRMPWLLFLMVSATFTGAIITKFEDALSAYVILTAYIPMLMDTGGNAGSQASVSIIRSLSLKEIEFANLFKIIWKEIRVAVLCGLTLAAANFLKLIFLDRLTVSVAAVICLTLLMVVVIAKLIGCCLPMITSKLGFDPAVMASPMITTIVDALSLLAYFNIATRLLHLNI